MPTSLPRRGRMPALVFSLTGALAGSLSLAVLATAPTQAADRAVRTGTVQLVVRTPAGVPANVVLDGPTTQVFAKGAGGKLVATRSVKAGDYRLQAPMASYEGRLYRATVARSVEVERGRTTQVTVVYDAVGGASRLRAADITTDSVRLRWAQPRGTAVKLRRTSGTAPTGGVTSGSAVAVSGASAVDTVAPGRSYRYALFSKVGGDWVGPQVLRVRTPSEARPAATALPRSTVVLAKGDAGRLTSNGDTISVAVPDGTRPPTIGAGVSIVPNQMLPGGYLGRVVAVAPDGSSYDVSAGGLSDVVDYLDADLDLDHVGEVPFDDPAPVLARSTGKVLGMPSGRLMDGIRTARRAPGCTDGAEVTTETLDPAGHFTTSVRNLAGKPATATYDAALTFATDLAVDVDNTTDGIVGCYAQYAPVYVKLLARPVPIVLGIAPITAVQAEPGVTVSNLGVVADGGVTLHGDFGRGDLSDGQVVLDSAAPTETTVTRTGAVLAGVGAVVGLGALGGPSSSTPPTAVSAMLAPAVFQGDTYFDQEGDVRRDSCLVGGGYVSSQVMLQPRAFIGDDGSPVATNPGSVNTQMPYSEDPWFLPTGCEDTPEPQEALTGEGVDIATTETTGSTDQWGHLAGFAPDESAWVLSTGSVGAAVGDDPTVEASGDLGLPGSPEMDTLAQAETHDQAGLDLSVTPTGSTLHVRYVFASEEWPEWVNSGYNDVMAVYVDGQNCAFVPGTQDPVSINTINADTNTEYYVDNTAGASGYHTVMDALTTPLQCDVAVTPGQPVDVSIQVADAGDGSLDSAIALIDGGIWSD